MKTLRVLARQDGYELGISDNNTSYLSYEGRAMEIDYPMAGIQMIVNADTRHKLAAQLFGGK